MTVAVQKILLHICCAPCSIYTIDHLRSEGFEPHGFFYNPNIHPYQEYRRRLDTLVEHAANTNLPLTVRDEYDLEGYLTGAVQRLEDRCQYCYETRLRPAAQEAAEKGYEIFGTTLLISPYQDQEALRRIGNQLAQEYGIAFYDQDLRPGFREGQKRARELGLYLQPYCGCIFSERDRYAKKG